MKINNENYIVQNDYIDDVIKNPCNYPKEDIFYLAYYFKCLSKPLFDSLLINYVMEDNINDFVDELIVEELYLKYINDVSSSPNKFMKAFVALFLENGYLDIWFENDQEIVDSIINTNDYDTNTKIAALSRFTCFDLSDDIINSIKINTKNIIKKDKVFSEREKEGLINYCINIYDTNHINVVNSLKLKNKEG